MAHFFGEGTTGIDCARNVVKNDIIGLDTVMEGTVFEIDLPHALDACAFGPVGSPSRLPGTAIDPDGADVIMERYRFVDVGNRDVSVDKDTFRLVTGLRGNFGAWDFDVSRALGSALTRAPREFA